MILKLELWWSKVVRVRKPWFTKYELFTNNKMNNDISYRTHGFIIHRKKREKSYYFFMCGNCSKCSFVIVSLFVWVLASSCAAHERITIQILKICVWVTTVEIPQNKMPYKIINYPPLFFKPWLSWTEIYWPTYYLCRIKPAQLFYLK